MRLVTWNCNKGAYSNKVPMLDPMAADLAVIQECERPSGESTRCLWFGDKPNQGILVLAAPGYSIRRLPAVAGVPKFVIPIGVRGPEFDFTLLAVWAKGASMGGYVDCVLKALNRYRELISSSRCVLMGDFNSSIQYTSMCPAHRNHATLLELLASTGFVSAYHTFFEEEQGRESRPTFYQQWSELKPFHIDYCFIPRAWQRRVTSVMVDGFESWRTASDHRPLIVDIDFDHESPVSLNSREPESLSLELSDPLASRDRR